MAMLKKKSPKIKFLPAKAINHLVEACHLHEGEMGLCRELQTHLRHLSWVVKDELMMRAEH